MACSAPERIFQNSAVVRALGKRPLIPITAIGSCRAVVCCGGVCGAASGVAVDTVVAEGVTMAAGVIGTVGAEVASGAVEAMGMAAIVAVAVGVGVLVSGATIAAGR